MITRAVGAEEKVRTDFFDVEIRKGDQILLCTDGLTNMVPNEYMADIVFTTESIEEKAKKLVNMAEENGGRDNITVILIEM